MPSPSFNYAIFKRLQASFYADFGLGGGGGHMASNPAQLLGGFSLIYPDDPHGAVMGTLSSGASPGGPTQGSSPLAAVGDNVPTDSPLYQMLAQSIGPDGTVPFTVNVAGQNWPVMPPPEQVQPAPALGTQTNPLWKKFNTGNPPPLINAFGQWLMAGRPDDSPKGAISQPTLAANPPPSFPGAQSALLFVASFLGDDGRRFGDGEQPGVPLAHVPSDFWAQSQIFLCNASGQVVMPGSLSGEYAVAAVIGNSGQGFAGSVLAASVTVTVFADAECFGTFVSPAVSLPSLGNLDPADTTAAYEQFLMLPKSWDVAGFRFNVSSVFSQLASKLDPNKLGGKPAAEWLKEGHPCVKVRVLGGEQANLFPPSDPDPPQLDSTSPRLNRHISQRNLAPFDGTLMAIKKPFWTDFIVSQAGHGPNGLTIEPQNWPLDDIRFWFAMPPAFYERYVAKGGHRGFELVREGVPKPFPDCVLLRQTAPGSRLVIEDHAREGYFGMALGIEGDPARLNHARLGDVAVAHTAQDGRVVGGFSLRPQVALRRQGEAG
jgi:hypothetical protein